MKSLKFINVDNLNQQIFQTMDETDRLKLEIKKFFDIANDVVEIAILRLMENKFWSLAIEIKSWRKLFIALLLLLLDRLQINNSVLIP